MHQCNERNADVIVGNIHYRLDTLAECKHLGRLRGTAGIEFPNYFDTRARLEQQHKDELKRRRAEEREKV